MAYAALFICYVYEFDFSTESKINEKKSNNLYL